MMPSRSRTGVSPLEAMDFSFRNGGPRCSSGRRRRSRQCAPRSPGCGLHRAVAAAPGRSVGQPLRSHVPTPPSATCIDALDAVRAAAATRPARCAGRTSRSRRSAYARRRPRAGRRCRGTGMWTEPGMWPFVPLGALAHVEHLHVRPSGACSSATSMRSAATRSGASPRASSSSRRRDSRRALTMPTAAASRTARCASSSSRPMKHDLLVAVGDPGELGAEPGAHRRDCRRRRGCGRRRTACRCGRRRAARPRRATPRPGAGSAGAASTRWATQRPAVEGDDRLEVRRLRAERGAAARTNASSSSSASSALWRTLVPDRRGDLHVHPRPAAQRAAEVPGPDLALARQRQQRVAQRAEHAPRALLLVDREVGAGDVADEQRVAGQDGPRLGAAGGVDQRERRVLGPVAGRVQRAHDARCRARAPSRRRTARARSRARRAGGRGSSRRSRRRGDRGRRRGRRGCGSRGCARSARPCSAPGRGSRSISSFGSTTAATPACSSPTR